MKHLLFSLGSLFLASTVNAYTPEFIYKPASALELSLPNQKVTGTHRDRFVKPYEVQRLTKNIYWISVANYNVTAVVGNKSVMLIDAPHGTGKNLLQAIKSFTDKPLSTIVYSHAHADHVGDSHVIAKQLAPKQLNILSSTEVKNALETHKVTLPLKVTHTFDNTLKFEGHTIQVHDNFNGHTPDNTVFILEEHGRKVIHAIDLVHPDQLEFRSFSNVEDAIAYKNDIDTLMALDWDVMVTGHSNLGYKADVQFVQDYIIDVQNFIRQGLEKTDFSKHFKGESPFTWYAGYTNEIIDFAHKKMAEKYRKGREEEFDIVAYSHVRVMFWAMFARAL
ncbi:MBL fold metallo-hydrolase [Pseudoalteromonas luteoviolacea]|uniref:MBL fold metallo-hydrolase n=1 Tax=Pseudoalteromonas luteoviolacea TaxID=43657 RepID=UPI001F1664E4|nr:MBL fold metallo-hydrolase [Pseudoalteromonas luteoviolacea]MCF6442877.1 MBL fold metallo-hydrolase [Pseudoalteromonas luteoviolacea]